MIATEFGRPAEGSPRSSPNETASLPANPRDDSAASFPSEPAREEVPNLIGGWSCRLRFADQELEKTYCDECSATVLKSSKWFAHYVTIMFVSFIALFQIMSKPG